MIATAVWLRLAAGVVLAGAVCLGWPAELSAQVLVEDGVVTHMDPLPKRLEGIDIEEHLDRQLPLGLQFKDTSGETVALSRYVAGVRPVIFTLNYSDCPMLCSLQLSGLVAVLGKLDRQLGKDFEIVTVSLDPLETSARAAETEARYRGELVRPDGHDAWHFLTGSKANIDALANTLGIRYAYNEKRKEYVHPASLVLVTPSGHVSRYLYGIEYKPRTLSLSLVEAAQGKVGSSVDRLILYCFHYDATEGRYAPMAMNLMRIGGGLSALCLAAFLGAYWMRQLRRRASRAGVVLGAPAEDPGS